MLLDSFRERAENNAQLGQLLLKRSSHGDAVEHRIHRHAREVLLLLERNAQLLVSAQDLGIQLFQACEILRTYEKLGIPLEEQKHLERNAQLLVSAQDLGIQR